MLTSNSSADLLSAEGPFAEQWESFFPREGQLQMTAAVEHHISSSPVPSEACEPALLLEAPSGLGKTLAYLVPVIHGQKRAIISTASRFLQQQLYRQDIPLVAGILNKSPKLALLQGRSHYLCPYYLERNTKSATAEALAVLLRVSRRFRKTGQGELADYALLLEPATRRLVSCDSDDCLGESCPQYESCPLMRARQRAREADIVVVNHSVLLAEQVMRRDKLGELLPAVDVVLVDEAHRLTDFAETIVGMQLTSKKLKDFCRQAEAVIGEYCPEQRALMQFVVNIGAAVNQLGSSAQQVNELQQQSVIENFYEIFTRLTKSLQQLTQRDPALLELSIKSLHFQERLFAILESEDVSRLQVRDKGFVLQSIPLSVSSLLQQLMNQSCAPWVFTSATLSVAGNVTAFTSAVGLLEFNFIQIASEVDYSQQAQLYLPPIAVEPQHPEFCGLFVDELVALLQVVRGRVLVLFSSHQSLQQAALLLREKSSRPLLVQQSPSVTDAFAASNNNNYRLIEQFKRHADGVLLATGSFWEGLDLSGAPLSAVVIDKLPFASPDSTLIQMRSVELDAYGVDSFTSYMLPAAVIRLRQGCGRLLRRKSDRGVIMIADPRLRSRAYGKVFLESLPPMEQLPSLSSLELFFRDELVNEWQKIEESSIAVASINSKFENSDCE